MQYTLHDAIPTPSRQDWFLTLQEAHPTIEIREAMM